MWGGAQVNLQKAMGGSIFKYYYKHSENYLLKYRNKRNEIQMDFFFRFSIKTEK